MIRMMGVEVVQNREFREAANYSQKIGVEYTWE